MAYYRHHLFFCTNRREDGGPCCAQHGAEAMRDYLKARTKALDLAGPGGVRVNLAGCLDRCAEGPVLVVYPEGTGPIGLCTLMALRAEGAGAIYATEKIEARERAAMPAGAQWTGNPDREDVVGSILAHEQHGLDVVFECCGEQSALDQAVALLKPGGTLVVVDGYTVS